MPKFGNLNGFLYGNGEDSDSDHGLMHGGESANEPDMDVLSPMRAPRGATLPNVASPFHADYLGGSSQPPFDHEQISTEQRFPRGSPLSSNRNEHSAAGSNDPFTIGPERMLKPVSWEEGGDICTPFSNGEHEVESPAISPVLSSLPQPSGENRVSELAQAAVLDSESLFLRNLEGNHSSNNPELPTDRYLGRRARYMIALLHCARLLSDKSLEQVAVGVIGQMEQSVVDELTAWARIQDQLPRPSPSSLAGQPLTGAASRPSPARDFGQLDLQNPCLDQTTHGAAFVAPRRSQVESRLNAQAAKMLQECGKVSRAQAIGSPDVNLPTTAIAGKIPTDFAIAPNTPPQEGLRTLMAVMDAPFSLGGDVCDGEFPSTPGHPLQRSSQCQPPFATQCAVTGCPEPLGAHFVSHYNCAAGAMSGGIEERESMPIQTLAVPVRDGGPVASKPKRAGKAKEKVGKAKRATAKRSAPTSRRRVSEMATLASGAGASQSLSQDVRAPLPIGLGTDGAEDVITKGDSTKPTRKRKALNAEQQWEAPNPKRFAGGSQAKGLAGRPLSEAAKLIYRKREDVRRQNLAKVPAPAGNHDAAPFTHNPSTSAPSRFCHICTRTANPETVKVCKNVFRGTCRKIICYRCAVDLEWDLDALKGDDNWTCTHCRLECPPKAQCHTYRRVNQHRRADGKRFRKGATKEATLADSEAPPRPTP